MSFKSMRLRIRGKAIMRMGQGARNPHQLHLRCGLSYPTVRKYIERSNSVRSFSSSVLPKILIDGLGLSPEQVLDLKIGDLFELVPVEDGSSAADAREELTKLVSPFLDGVPHEQNHP